MHACRPFGHLDGLVAVYNSADTEQLRETADRRLRQITAFRQALRLVGERLLANGYGESGMYHIVKEALENEQPLKAQNP